jgi:hypothetical protein
MLISSPRLDELHAALQPFADRYARLQANARAILAPTAERLARIQARFTSACFDNLTRALRDHEDQNHER